MTPSGRRKVMTRRRRKVMSRTHTAPFCCLQDRGEKGGTSSCPSATSYPSHIGSVFCSFSLALKSPTMKFCSTLLISLLPLSTAFAPSQTRAAVVSQEESRGMKLCIRRASRVGRLTCHGGLQRFSPSFFTSLFRRSPMSLLSMARAILLSGHLRTSPSRR